MQTGNTYDAVIIGGGPAGSTAAAVLASKGRRVVVLEKEKFPRYHIGESLLPYGYFTLERIGVLDRMKASHFTRKYSVQFVGASGRASVPFYFSQQLAHEAHATWQVLRSEFDQLLLDNAREKGAEVIEEITARELIQPDGAVTGVKAVTKDGEPREFYAPITIDATGRDAFAVTRNGWKVRDPQLNKIAVWTYYKGALRDAGIDEGATTVAYVPEKGWFWYIPLANDIVSVGVVAEKDYLYQDTHDLSAIFHREVKKNAWIENHLAVGQQFGPYRVTGEYSYRSRHCAADGLVLAGDAFGFLDPVFSSGVLLALRSGELAADAVDAALEAGDVSAARFAAYGAQVCEGIEAMRKLVYAFYNHVFSFRVFITEYPQLKGDMTDCLMGNLFRDFQPLFDAVAKFAAVPEPLPHGKPMTAWRTHSCVPCRDSSRHLRVLLSAILPDNPFYAAKLRGISPDAELSTLPFTLKQELIEDQQAHPPYGSNLTYPIDRYTRFCQTSATTTGTPMRWLDTPESWNWMIGNWNRVYRAAGIGPGDRIFFAFSFGPFLGFWVGFEAATHIGCLAIPGGGMRSAARLRTIVETCATVLCCTPTYAIRLAEVAAEENIDLSAASLHTLIVAGEPGGSVPATRQLISKLWRGARVVDHHGMTEIGPVSYGCPKRPGVLHVIEDSYIAEVIDPATGQPVPRGVTGELVLTNLGRIGSPLLRYRTSDIVQAAPGDRCECGTQDLALNGGILDRTDDMLVVRGVNVYPSAVENIVRGFDAVGEYRVEIQNHRTLPELTIQVEAAPSHAHDATLTHRLEAALTQAFALRIPVALVPQGSLPRFEMKARRWVNA